MQLPYWMFLLMCFFVGWGLADFVHTIKEWCNLRSMKKHFDDRS